jgi:hypothetical protein
MLREKRNPLFLFHTKIIYFPGQPTDPEKDEGSSGLWFCMAIFHAPLALSLHLAHLHHD